MKLAVLHDQTPGERRAAISPDAVKRYISLGFDVTVEKGSGKASAISDDIYAQAGARIAAGTAETCADAQIVLTVNAPAKDSVQAIPSGAVLAGMLAPYQNRGISSYASRNISAFAMEFLPRISRAQAMDVLSSQSNLAGYRAVIDAVHEMHKATPMMMTAAGTVPPAKVLVLGAGVAGLQAIATARRMGAVVSAFDVRPAVKEQVESLGAKFIEVPAEESAETAGGYAKEMSEEYKRRQSTLIHETLKKQDIAITTALIPGKPAPVLITEAMVKDMRLGSVIVDLAVAAGGNCPLSKPEEIVEAHGVKIIGYTNMPSRVAVDATPLYARNLYNFVALLVNKEKQIMIPMEDEIIKSTLLTHGGAVVHPTLAKG